MKIYKEQEVRNVVYFASFKSGLTKIGTTSNLKNRLQGLRHQCGFEEMEYFCVEGSYSVESYFKRKFKHYNTFGEWFKLDLGTFEKIIKKIDIKNILEESQEECVNTETNTLPPYSPFHVRDRVMKIHTRYANDLINAPFIKDEYKDYENSIKELLDFNKELGEEEYNEALEDIEYIRDKYDLFCYVDRYEEYSSYAIDHIFKKYINNEISYITLLRTGFEELKKINCKSSSMVYFEFELESRIATLIESWKMLDISDKEIYSKIKEKI